MYNRLSPNFNLDRDFGQLRSQTSQIDIGITCSLFGGLYEAKLALKIRNFQGNVWLATH